MLVTIREAEGVEGATRPGGGETGSGGRSMGAARGERGLEGDMGRCEFTPGWLGLAGRVGVVRRVSVEGEMVLRAGAGTAGALRAARHSRACL